MAPSGKRPVGNADRLSDLPDGLIHSIMAFLTAREAVQTCVLSRRWEDLWCSMPCLDIDERQFHVIGSRAYYEVWDDMSEDEDDIDSASLEEFVNNLLMFHSAPRLDRFRFHVASSHGNTKFVNSWIRRGVKRCPKVVEIHSTDGCKLPHLGGSSSSRLNRLHLTGITLDKTFTQQLRSTCPVLDDLELRRCRLDGHTEIVSFTLNKLTIVDCTTNNPSALTIKAPSLTYLQLVITALDRNWQAVVVNQMTRLNKATICLKDSTAMLPCKLLSSLMFAEDLQLTGLRTLANLHIGSGTFPVFCSVRILLLDKCDLSDSCDILGNFLNNAPYLEKLTLQQCKLPECSKKSKAGGNVERTSLQCQETPSFQCLRLKRTEIKYDEDDDVQKLFDLLLGIWRNLQKSTIVIKKASRSYSMM
ncbi:MEIOTIC F-BOX protein MOF [Lolium perenne]|uniref:MEIOTIC F-BOX protein MOF n=1 Tax=Lolium perenne TaxID=4522 RepID=UPI0021F61474|nr:MEIOTIC F-BOX protein MOF-like [Lolium perenne]